MKLTTNTLFATTNALIAALLLFMLLPATATAGGSHHSDTRWFEKSRSDKYSFDQEKSGRKCDKKECDNSLTIPLYVDGDTRVGKVTVRLDNSDLKVTYQVNDGWHLIQTDLDIADTYNGLHLNSDGSPDIASFPYHSKHFLPVNSADYIISAQQWPLGTDLYIAAEAIVVTDAKGKCEQHSAHGHRDSGKDSHGKKHGGDQDHSSKDGHGHDKHKGGRDQNHDAKYSEGHHDNHEYDETDDNNHDDSHENNGKTAEMQAWAVGEKFPGQALAAYFIYKLESCDSIEQSIIQFSDAIYSVNEGDAEVLVTVVRTGNLNQASSVEFTTVDGTAINGMDYLFTSGVLTFAPGQATAQFPVAPIDDSEVEAVENLSLVLSNPLGATLGQQSTAMVEIEDNDVTPVAVIEFSQAEFIYQERVPYAVITVVRSGDLSNEAQVDFTTAAGTATVNSDYIATSGTLVFPAGVQSLTFQVRLINDREIESDETVLLQLFNEIGATLGTQKDATLIIQDDDGMPT